MEQSVQEAIVIELLQRWKTHFADKRNLIETKDSLSEDQTIQYLISLLKRDPAVFLEKYGDMLSFKSIEKFKTYDDYEVNWFINNLLENKKNLVQSNNASEELRNISTPIYTVESNNKPIEQDDPFTLEKQLKIQRYRRQQQNNRSKEELQRRNRRFKAMQKMMESSEETEKKESETPFQPNKMPTPEELEEMQQKRKPPEGPISSMDDHIGGAVDAADKEYFTKDSMMMRRPDLYRDYIGKWDPQGIQRPLFKNMKLYERLLTNMDLEGVIQNMKKHDVYISTKNENESQEEEDEEEEEEEEKGNNDNNNTEPNTEMMDVSSNHDGSNSESDEKEEIEIDDNDKDFMEKEFLKEMKDHFIFGEDAQYFDYDKYDNSAEWDDLKQREIDEEEQYFEKMDDDSLNCLHDTDAVNEDDQSSSNMKRDTASDEELEDWEKDIW